MIGIYFSGTGNTKFCVERFLQYYGNTIDFFPMEEERAVTALCDATEILLAYPVYYSNLPKIVRDFITKNSSLFAGKKIYIIATMGLFSGDGAGCGARLMRRCHAKILGGLHVKMPDCISDEKVLKRTSELNRKIIQDAEKKLKNAAESLKAGKPVREGLGLGSHAAGLLGQRLWFYTKTQKYSSGLKINLGKCIGCGKCMSLCPMENITIREQKAFPHAKCTMCYRCVNRCPVQAITLLGKRVYEQSSVEKYL